MSQTLNSKKLDAPRPLVDHLDELRRRIIVILFIVAILFAGCLTFVDDIIKWMAEMTGGFVFLTPTEALFTRIKVSLMCAVLLAVPLIIFEVWKFIGIALKPGEKKFVFSVVPVSYILFLAGAGLAWLVVIPYAVKFLLGFQSDVLQPALSIDKFVGFSIWLTLAFGAMFQLPLVVLALTQTGILEPDTLAAYRPHVFLGLAIASAFLTPGPDFISQLALLIPSCLLFEGSLLAARFFRKE